MSGSTLGLALIARDEQENLPHLLTSIEGSFDQVVLLDTGSEDRTVEVFEGWAKAPRQQMIGLRYKIGHFEWCDDFAAARQAADDLLDTDWLCWADCDEVVIRAGAIRKWVLPDAEGNDAAVVQMARAELHAPGCPWLYYLPRLRRAGSDWRWTGRLHESLRSANMDVQTGIVPIDLCRFVHRRSQYRATSLDRNFQLAKQWVREEPDNPQAAWHAMTFEGYEEAIGA